MNLLKFLLGCPARIFHYASRDHKLLAIRRIEKNLLKKWLVPGPGEKILDLACGMGGGSQIVTSKEGEYYGADINYKDVVKARKRFRTSEFVNMDVLHSAFKKDTFDKVFCNSSLQQFYDDEEALKNICYCLKPSGILVLTLDSLSMDGLSRRLRDKHRIRYNAYQYYDKQTISSKLSAAEFEVANYKYYFNSPVSDFFFSLGIIFGFNSWIQYLFPVSYPLILISDYVFGAKDCGCALAVRAVKK